MKITKYDHSCMVLDKDSTRLVIDPGSFTELPSNLDGIAFVIVTEEHHDHFSLDNLKKIIDKNPDVQIYTTTAVHNELIELGINAHAISGNQSIELGDFQVEFSETDHAIVYQSSPCKSLAIKIDAKLYYPSDTYRTIDDKITVFALPTSGPWFKVAQSIEFANAIKSEVVLVTHNALNSPIGNKVTNNFIASNIDGARELMFLENGESFEVK